MWCERRPDQIRAALAISLEDVERSRECLDIKEIGVGDYRVQEEPPALRGGSCELPMSCSRPSEYSGELQDCQVVARFRRARIVAIRLLSGRFREIESAEPVVRDCHLVLIIRLRHTIIVRTVRERSERLLRLQLGGVTDIVERLEWSSVLKRQIRR